MIDKVKRNEFINYLHKIIKEPTNPEDWFKFIIEHYVDQKLEEVRRNIVRLRIAEGDPKIFPTTDEQRKVIKNWAEELHSY